VRSRAHHTPTLAIDHGSPDETYGESTQTMRKATDMTNSWHHTEVPHRGSEVRGVRGMLRRRVVGGGLAVLGLVVMAGAALPGAAWALPEGRVYELVSPVYKGGFGVQDIEGVAPDGESVAFYSPGAFAGAPSGAFKPDYLARREASGWTTSPLMPPADLLPDVTNFDLSPSLESAVVLGKPGANSESASLAGSTDEFMLHSTALPDTNAGWEIAGEPFEQQVPGTATLLYFGGSPDFCHLLLQTPEASEAGPAGIYESDRGCGGQSTSLQLVGVNDEGQPISALCRIGIGAGIGNAFDAISDDGEEVFFSTAGCENSTVENPQQVFVRLGGARTLEISKLPSESDSCAEVSSCKKASERAPAEFAGASRDGSSVYFTTAAPLIGEDTDTGNDLYLAKIGCPEDEPECEAAAREVRSLVQVSHDPNGGEAAVQGVLRVAPNGSRVYFVAGGDLLAAGARQTLEGEGRAVPRVGAENLYVYDDSAQAGAGGVAFIGDLCSGHERSGTVEDRRCPSSTGNDMRLLTPECEVQTAGEDGRFLVFASFAQLLSGDTDATADVYRYDAVTGKLDRVSLGERGYDANGNAGSFDAQIASCHRGGSVRNQYELDNRAISEDGSRIVFRTSAPLSPAASNGLTNVYEWHETPDGEGEVSLISGGSGDEPVEDVVISPTGSDIFFVTAQGLVPQDSDGTGDVYDARLDGGFPPAGTARQACSGDACQGPLTSPAPLLVPGSVAQAPGENLASPTGSAAPKKQRKAHGKRSQNKKRKRKARRARARGKRIASGGRGR